MGVESDEPFECPVEVVSGEWIKLQSEDNLILVFFAVSILVVEHYSFRELSGGHQFLGSHFQFHFLAAQVDED